MITRLDQARTAVNLAAQDFRFDPTPESANAIALAIQYWEFLHDGSDG